jgi:hypothetical protein
MRAFIRAVTEAQTAAVNVRRNGPHGRLRILAAGSTTQFAQQGEGMSIVLYVGGSKDGMKGVVPYGFRRSRAMTDAGPEVYVERVLALDAVGKVRVMALESLQDEIVVQRTAGHYAR